MSSHSLHHLDDTPDAVSAPPLTPQMQNSAWKSGIQHYTPCNSMHTVLSPGSSRQRQFPSTPESPSLPLSPVSPNYNVYNRLDSHTVVSSLESPQQRQILPRQQQLKHPQKYPISRTPKQVGELTLGKLVGSGSFSQTYQAFGYGSVFAVKKRLPSVSADLFAHEYSVLAKLVKSVKTDPKGSLHVVQFHPELSESNHMVFKLYTTSLDEVVKSPSFQIDPNAIDIFDFRILDWPVIGIERWCNWATQLKAGLEFIHRHNIVHADLKPDNVLVSKDYQLVIADFSSAIDMDVESTSPLAKELTNGLAWSPIYTDPNVRSGISLPSFGSDIYAMGLILSFMATGNDPYGSAKNMTQRLLWMDKVRPLDSFDPELRSKLSKVRPVIESCLSRSFAHFEEALAKVNRP